MANGPDRRVALLRGINVGTAKRIAMADLRHLVESLGYTDVRTLLNSGNVVLTVPRAKAADPAPRIQKAIQVELGLEVPVLVLRGDELATAIDENPLRKIANDPSRLLLFVPRDASAIRLLQPVAQERWTPEALALGSRCAYIWCPQGVIDSRIWPAVNKVLGDGGTSRNFATMTKLMTLVGRPDA